jgi:hypothetical protein
VASEELENSLRDEIDGFITGRLQEVQEQVARLQDEVTEAFARVRERQTTGGSLDPLVAEKISGHLRSAHEAGMQEANAASESQKAASGIAVLKAAIDDIDDQRTQADILNMLVNRAGSFAPRVAFFVVKGDRLNGWRARGLAGTVGDDAIREISLGVDSETAIAEAIRSRATFSGSAEDNAGDQEFVSRLGENVPQGVVAVPLVVRGKAVAVLYSDSADLEPKTISIEALESLVRVASMAVELLAVSRTTPVARAPRVEPPPPAVEETQPQESPAEASATEPAAVEAEELQPVQHDQEPEPSAEPEPAYHYEPQYEAQPEAARAEPQYEQEPQTAQEPEPQPEIESQPTAQPEPASAFPSYPAAEPETVAAGSPFSAPLGTARRYGNVDVDIPVDVSDDEKRLHNDARRFARLLVSEIKLYNEQKVREGRIQQDIYARLREDIDRSREMYDKRADPRVAARFDYFHNELVNTLAEGDPSKLGPSYPNNG